MIWEKEVRRPVSLALSALLFLAFCTGLGKCSFGWQVTIATDRSFYQPGDTVQMYGSITYNGWWSWGNGTCSVSIGIMGPQNNISATAPIDDDGRFSYNLVNVQDVGPYTVRVNYRGAGTLVTNNTTFTVVNAQNLYFTHWDSLEPDYWDNDSTATPTCSGSNLNLTLPAGEAQYVSEYKTSNPLGYGIYFTRFKMTNFTIGLLGGFFLYYAPNGDYKLTHEEIDVEWWGNESSNTVHFNFWQNGGNRDTNGTPLELPTDSKTSMLPFSLDDGCYHLCEISYQPEDIKIFFDGTLYRDEVIIISPPLYFFTGLVSNPPSEPVPDSAYSLYVDFTEIYQVASTPWNGFSLAAMSPVNLLITDPLNRSTGFDPTTGNVVNDIPGAVYSGPNAEPQILLLPDPLAGNYQSSVFGTGNGSYTVALESIVNSSFINADTWQGTVNAGDTIKKDVRLDTDGIIVLPQYIRITNLALSKTVIGQGYIIYCNSTVENYGNYTETFNVTACINETTIAEFTNLNLACGNWTSLSCSWNTSGQMNGNYTLRFAADTVPGQEGIADNTLSATVTVTMPGDVDGNCKVDIGDIVIALNAFGSTPGHPRWNANADIDGNSKVDIGDLIISLDNFGQHHP